MFREIRPNSGRPAPSVRAVRILTVNRGFRAGIGVHRVGVLWAHGRLPTALVAPSLRGLSWGRDHRMTTNQSELTLPPALDTPPKAPPPRGPSELGEVNQLGLWAGIASLGYVFWIVGGMEMVERLAY